MLKGFYLAGLLDEGMCAGLQVTPLLPLLLQQLLLPIVGIAASCGATGEAVGAAGATMEATTEATMEELQALPPQQVLLLQVRPFILMDMAGVYPVTGPCKLPSFNAPSLDSVPSAGVQVTLQRRLLRPLPHQMATVATCFGAAGGAGEVGATMGNHPPQPPLVLQQQV
jgi:hypothetical protein